jgi:hypothetical protein
MVHGRLAFFGRMLASAALVCAGSASAQTGQGPTVALSAPGAAVIIGGLSMDSSDAWSVEAATLRGAGARSFAGGMEGSGGFPSVLHDMPLSRADRGVQAPPVARYAAGAGEVFVFDRSSGAPLLKFEDNPEIWVLRPSPAPRGDIIYRNDLGEPILRATRLGGLTLFSANTPGGEAAAMLGDADDLQPPPFLSPGTVFQRMLQSSARASHAAQHLIRFEAPDVTPESAPVFVDAAAAASEAVIVLSRRDDGRAFLRRLIKMQFQPAAKPGATVASAGDGGRVSMQVFVNIAQGESGRPSSEWLVRAALGN